MQNNVCTISGKKNGETLMIIIFTHDMLVLDTLKLLKTAKLQEP